MVSGIGVGEQRSQGHPGHFHAQQQLQAQPNRFLATLTKLLFHLLSLLPHFLIVKLALLKQQVTWGHNIVADGWAGASNPQPHPSPNPKPPSTH